MNALALVAMLTLPAADAGSARPITEKNWQTHEEIVAIRKLVEVTEADLKAKKLRYERREPGCINYSGDHTRELVQDGKGRVRKFVVEEGSGDSMFSARHYYDDAGRLRFLFIRLGRVTPESIVEKRVYFSPDGRRLWETAMSQRWPDELLVRDPKTRFERVEEKCDPDR